MKQFFKNLNQIKMETNNKLIAEFIQIENTGLSIYAPSQYKFHTSWDWLMPVVKECYDKGAEGDEIGDITHGLLDCDIEATYDAVVVFIKSIISN